MLHFWIFGDFVDNLKEKGIRYKHITLNDSFQGPLHFKILVLGNAYINKTVFFAKINIQSPLSLNVQTATSLDY